MSRNHIRANRSRTGPLIDANDALGNLLVKQRPDVVLDGASLALAPTQTFYHASEKISDPSAIAALLSSCSNLSDESEDDLIFELMYLETLLASQPLRSAELLEQLGSLGDEVRDGLLVPGVVDVMAIRRRTRAIRQQMGVMASRMTAAMLLLVTSLPFFGEEAQAAKPIKEGPQNNSFQVSAAPVVRVVDANSGNGVAGVQIKSMEEEILGVTDQTGQATLSDKYMETDLLSLEKEGYQMYLLDRSQLSSRNIVSMKPLQDGGSATALLQKAPSSPSGAQPPKVVHQPGHAPKLEPPKPPTAPKSPSVKVPLRPKAPKAAASVQPKTDTHAAHTAPKPAAPKAVAAKPAAPAHADHHAAAPKAPASHAPAHAPAHAAAPKLAAPKAPVAPKAPAHHAAAPKAESHGMTEVYSAPKAAPKAVAPKAHVAATPAKPRMPLAAAAPAHTTVDHEAEGVSVPKYQPAPKMDAHESTGGTYRVRPGDSLSKIAKMQLGSAKRWPELYAANKGAIRNPHWIQVGQTISVPGASVAAHNTGTKTYIVRRGDSLSRIAAAQLGDSAQWDKIFAANRDAIRNPHVIFPGMRIVLPT